MNPITKERFLEAARQALLAELRRQCEDESDGRFNSFDGNYGDFTEIDDTIILDGHFDVKLLAEVAVATFIETIKEKP